MYYEEKIIDGVLHFRTTPNGEWFFKTASQLTETITTLRAEVESLRKDATRWDYFAETASEEVCYILCGNSNPDRAELDLAIDQRIANND